MLKWIISIFVIAVLFLVDFFGMRSRAWIFTVAGESGIKAYIPIVKCATYGKISNRRTCGIIEGLCSIVSKVLLILAVRMIISMMFRSLLLVPASVFSILVPQFGDTLPGLAEIAVSEYDIANILLITGVILLAVQWICRGIVRYRVDKIYGIHPAMLILWVFLPHIAEILASQRITTGNLVPETENNSQEEING